MNSADINHLNPGFNAIRCAVFMSSESSLSTNLRTHSSSMVLRAVGADIFNDREMSEVVNTPSLASKRSKTVTLSFDAVDSTTPIIKGISSSVTKFRPIDNACPLAKLVNCWIALSGSSIVGNAYP